MIKIILGVLVTVFVIVSTVVVLYWRDINYDPDTKDMFIFFGLVPVAISLLLLMPFFIKQWYQENKIKKQNEEALKNKPQEESELKPVKEDIKWVNLHVFSAATYSALGENDEIWMSLTEFKSPELDAQLQNGYGLPILSYRISDLDDMVASAENDDSDESMVNARQLRIWALIQHQLEQHAQTLWAISEHLKSSALFFDTQLAHEYRMHPAWIDPNAEFNEEAYERPKISEVYKLNRLNLHIILSEDLLHTADESVTQEKLSQFLNELGILDKMFHVEYHYWGKETAYTQWFNLLDKIQNVEHEINLMVAVDSEIDQDTVDEKTWISEHYIPSEFVGSCCIAHVNVKINEISPQKIIKIALNDHQLFNTLTQLNYQALPQFQQEAPFVVQLDDPGDIKVVKRLEKNFAETQIEQHHYLFMKQSVGQTEHLAKIYGFMIALQAPEDVCAFVYSCEQPRTQSIIESFVEQSVEEQLNKEEATV